MADRKKIVKTNVEGDFFVDTTCINCDTCRQLASSVFKEHGDYSSVFKQPENKEERINATRALLSCPTGSIGNSGENLTRMVIDQFPLLIEDNVYYCGFNSPKSYGANSYFIHEEEGNWLIDSPKFNNNLVKKIEKMGGLKYIFLTHEDDVAEADKYAAHFKARRIIHTDALSAEPDAEIVIKDSTPPLIVPGFEIITTPGHTKGHMVLLYKNKFLFTGDHLYLDRETEKLDAFERHCWYSFEEQTRSMEKLLDYNFEWILAGHGDRGKLSRLEVKKQLRELVEKMRKL